LISDHWLRKIEQRFAAYIFLPEINEKLMRQLRAEIGFMVKVYGHLPKRLKNCILQFVRDPSFHADRYAPDRLHELLSRRNRNGMQFEVDGTICLAGWVPAVASAYK